MTYQDNLYDTLMNETFAQYREGMRKGDKFRVKPSRKSEGKKRARYLDRCNTGK